MTLTYGVPTDGQPPACALGSAVVITGLAAIAHLLAGGPFPGFGFLLAFGAVVFGCCLARASHLGRLPLLVGLVVAAQVGLHGLLETAAIQTQDGMPGTAGMASMEVPAAHPSALSAPMLWAHLIAALVTAIVLLCQDAVMVLVADWRERVRGYPVRTARQGCVPTPAPRVSGHQSGLLRVSPRRGPPLVLVATP